jgi:hypothetical protein
VLLGRHDRRGEGGAAVGDVVARLEDAGVFELDLELGQNCDMVAVYRRGCALKVVAAARAAAAATAGELRQDGQRQRVEREQPAVGPATSRPVGEEGRAL